MRICNTCKGYGYYWHQISSYKDNVVKKICTECDGTGKVPLEDHVRGYLPRDSQII